MDTIDAKKAAEAAINQAISSASVSSGTASSGTPKPTLSDTKAVPVTANPIDNDSLVKLTMDMTDMKALLEGMDKRMKEGFAALLLKVTGGKPVDAGNIRQPDYADILPTRANVGQGLQRGGKGTRKRRVLKKKSRATKK